MSVRFAVVALIVVVCAPASNASGDAAQQLKSITPAFAAPAANIFDIEDYATLPVRLLGIDLEQEGVRAAPPEAAVDGDRALTVRTYWEAKRRLASQVKVRSSVWDYMCLIRDDREWLVGPNGGAAWEVGEVHTQEFDLNLPELASSFSGRAYLTIAMLTPREPDWKDRALLLQPILILPVRRASNLPERRVRDSVPSGANVDLFFSRLGLDAELEVVVDSAAPNPAKFFIFSSMAYRSPRQGETVCTATFFDHDGRAASVPIRAGIETSRGDHDAYPEGGLDHERIAILRSRDSGQLDSRGRPVRIHTYIAELETPPGLGAVRAVRFRCVTETFFDLYGVAFAP